MAQPQQQTLDARIDPELRPVRRRLPKVTFTPWKVKLIRLTPKISLPSKVPRGIIYEGVPVGRYFKPSAPGEDHNGNANGEDGGIAKERLRRAAILWIHGGGRCLDTVRKEAPTCARLVQELGVPVLSVQYRLAPENPFPAALDDCIAAYEWLRERADPIAVAGESAGGGLAAELCQRLYDEAMKSGGDGSRELRRLRLPVAQVLVYPMLDDQTAVDKAKTELGHLFWNNTSNRFAWSAYLGPGHLPGDKELPRYAAAARRPNLSGLPPCWIMMGELDLFLDEGRAYASRLEEAGVETKFVFVKGGFHGMLLMGRGEKPVERVWDDMFDFLRHYLNLG